mgnify:CR=1 FL=1
MTRTDLTLWLRHTRGMLLALLVLIGGAGCSSLRPGADAPDAARLLPELRECLDWYTALDGATASAKVRDAGASRIQGFAHLRADRFSVSWRHLLDSDASPASAEDQAALLGYLAQLDLQARKHEIANLPAAARLALGQSFASAADSAALLQHTQTCAARLLAQEPGNAERLARLRAGLVVPDDYATGYRVFGLYALARVPFALGVERLEAERRRVFASSADLPHGDTGRLRLSPASRPAPHLVTPQALRAILARQPGDALRRPMPTAAQLELLFEQFAPAYDIGVRSSADLPGALVWRNGARGDSALGLEVDSSRPLVYRQIAYTRYGPHSLLQLVYTLWFPQRPAQVGSVIDLLAGNLDGLVWRVTLAPDGTPLVYDSMHPCGCYHMFFPTAAARSRPPPVAGEEWAFSPRALPAIGAADRLLLRIAPDTHYLEGVQVLAADQGTPFDWSDYDVLRSLPTPDQQSRSAFDQDGFVPGTDRAEAWLFWPMGIARAGSMRQWGRHATAFVGRRHFDDARLLEQRFEFDPAHFRD